MTPQEYRDFWGGSNTDDFANSKAAVYDNFVQIFGRPPTRDEANQFLPLYGGDPHQPDVATGNSALSQYKTQQDNTPDKVYARQQQEYQQKAPQYYDAIDQAFQGGLGRTATKEEKDHFGALLASGQYDQYQLGQYLQQLPEAVQTRDAEFRKGLGSEMASADQEYFSKNILPSIQDTYAKQGRSFDSSAFQAATANAAQAQNADRQKYIAGISAQQYAGNQANARADYEAYLNNYYNRSNAGVDTALNAQNRAFDRSNQMSDYAIQQRAYNDYLSRYGKRSNAGAIGGLAGGLLGAGVGAYFGGPAGASAGYQAGSGFGSGIGNLAGGGNY